MDPTLERIIARWKRSGIEPEPGVSNESIDHFKTKHGVRLPRDFRRLYKTLDGLAGIYDDDFFTFYELSDVESLNSAWPDGRFGSVGPQEYFCFADHSSRSLTFAFRLTNGIDTETPIATIFADGGKALIRNQWNSLDAFLIEFARNPFDTLIFPEETLG